MPIQQIPESCEGCGACCYGLIVQVHESDFADYDTPRELVEVRPDPAGGDPVLAMKQDASDHERCLALDPQTRLCTIYEQRPQTCRGFTRGDDPSDDNPVCFEAVEDMRVAQGRKLTAEPERLRQATRALKVLTGADIDAASVAEQLVFLRHVAELREGVSLTLLARMQARVQEAEIELVKMRRDLESLQGAVQADGA